MVGIGLGRPEDRQQAVADELVYVAAVPVDDRDHHLEHPVEGGTTWVAADSGVRREPAHVAEHDRHVDLHTLLGELPGEDQRGDLLVHVVRSLPHLLALLEPERHQVEVVGELADSSLV